ncbi:MAG TPA: hypothetical protein VHL53_00425 [Acidimicrobiia bacterium]|nr:hypothetical protein [Acidimicrobiia bacterium]
MGATRRARRLGLAVAVTLAAGGAAVPARAGGGPDWVATARASAADFGIVTQGGFIVDHFDPSGALATSRLETATETATSLAAAPYPSEIGQQGPGLLYGALQNTLPYNGIPVPALGEAPSWPFTIRSSANGSDPKSATAGGDSGPFGLRTESKDRVTTGHASCGGSAPGAFALFRSAADSTADATGAATALARAVSSVEGLSIGDVLKIGHISTDLRITRRAGAKATVTVNRAVDGISVAGTSADLSPEGFVVKGTGAPLPQPALDALKAAGIEVGIGEQRAVGDAVSASGLVVRRSFDFGGTKMTMQMAFGVVSATVTEIGDSEGAAPPMQLASATRPVPGTAGRKRLAWPGEAAELGAIAAVTVLVLRRARRVVGGR